MKKIPSQTEKKMIYGIRSLKNGTGSVLIGASIVLLSATMPTISANENLPQTQENTSAVTKAPTETETSQTQKETPISEQKNANASLDSEKEATAAKTTTAPEISKTEDATTSQTNSKEEKVDASTSTQNSNQKPQVDTSSEEPIADNHFRIHVKKLPEENKDSQGLWTWDDVEKPSENWPNGAKSFKDAKQDDYGYYLDVKLKNEQAKKVSFLINNTKGDNLTGDRSVERLSPKMNEAWLDENYKVYNYRPQPAGTVRVNYYRTDGNYNKKSLWYWGDVKNPSSGEWPDGTDFTATGKYGRYIDIPLNEAAREFGFLLLDESKKGDDVKIRKEDYKFTDLKNHSQIFLKDDDETIYTNPYYVHDIRMTGAQHVAKSRIESSFSTLVGAKKNDILKHSSITDYQGNKVAITDVEVDEAGKKVTYIGDFSDTQHPYTVSYNSDRFTTRSSWRLKDESYSYDGPLGATLKEDGKRVDLTLWSPSADKVSVVVYDKKDPEKVVGTVALEKGEKGTWKQTLDANSGLGISNYTGYYYHYQIERQGKTVLVLDPYAKSLAAWNSDLAKTDAAHKVAKAAFVDPAKLGPQDLTYGKIRNFKSREDAVIYEAHVRDFTSDPAIAKDLTKPFGTFEAFIEKLDYLKDLGVTHIQLLPVLSYYFVNELKNHERLSAYASSNSNYNWGYDPQNYFSLTGMYSSDPKDPEKRIAEFKNLINEIHKRGMGAILDVVYNHTANVDIFEDIEPNYYHFMDADGTPRTSFGGGRLGTTHYMSKRVLVDSIKYLVETYKVDGFRFDMMGDHDAASIEEAYKAARALNPNLIMLGEGWRTYTGDENTPVQPADQDWMKKTDTVAVFSDDIRNNLKSGYPNEGQPAFITGGKRDINTIFKNLIAQPTNFEADSPGDVIQYIAAHDNLTLFDIIAQSIKKDPSKAENYAEIHRRLRLGNLMVLTAQGTPFIHSGQEYGRTKQFLDPAYKTPVPEDKVPNKSHLLRDKDGKPFVYPYFIHDSYDSSDAVNKFDWTKATDGKAYPENVKSRDYMKGLIALRQSTVAFRLKSLQDIKERVQLITVPGQNGVEKEDVVIGYQITAPNGDIYAVFVNADSKTREFNLGTAFARLRKAEVLADENQAGPVGIANPQGLEWTEKGLKLNALTAVVLRLSQGGAIVAPAVEEKPEFDLSSLEVEPEQGQAQNLAANPETQETAAEAHSQNLLPNTGSESKSLLALAGFSILALLGLGWLMKNKKKN
ncbi:MULTISPECIES: pullulanase [Streptococcus]|uniref:pullulanase n=1 Tax=Streptococcus TaxID=1301 RepID=UPI000277F621|nr:MULTISPECIES: pullulanase [Streptococcus]EJO20549.1 pullulanase, extracellular [Streptococcus sp. BS35b]ETS89676.1 pullulanase, extracellular [Streptococcus sp. BS29a]EUB27255.1 pullulanase, extracellular [Streptococcus sp. BS21]MCY7104536.1 pullulanase [Streptococcus oralis]